MTSDRIFQDPPAGTTPAPGRDAARGLPPSAAAAPGTSVPPPRARGTSSSAQARSEGDSASAARDGGPGRPEGKREAGTPPETPAGGDAAPYAAPPAGSTLTGADDCTRVYAPHGKMAHLLPGDRSSTGYPFTLCRRQPWVFTSWLGTGSQDEYEKAAALPLCSRCARKAVSRG